MSYDDIEFIGESHAFLELTNTTKGVWAVTGDFGRIVVAISEQHGPVVATMRDGDFTTVVSGGSIAMDSEVWRVGQHAGLAMKVGEVLDYWQIGSVTKIELIS